MGVESPRLRVGLRWGGHAMSGDLLAISRLGELKGRSQSMSSPGPQRAMDQAMVDYHAEPGEP